MLKHAPSQPTSETARPPSCRRAPRATTISAQPRSPSAQLTLDHPGQRRSWLARLTTRYPDQAEHPTYDAALVRELLTRTTELPASKQALIAMLTEYRHALANLVAAPENDGQSDA